MKLIVVAACFATVVLAGPKIDPKIASMRALPALLHEEVRDERGQYNLHYVTAEGTEVIEKGRLVPNPDGKSLVLVIEGETKYITDGKVYITKYSAGLDGNRVQNLPASEAAQKTPPLRH